MRTPSSSSALGHGSRLLYLRIRNLESHNNVPDRELYSSPSSSFFIYFGKLGARGLSSVALKTSEQFDILTTYNTHNTNLFSP